MSIPLTEVVYPLDESGISPSNKIVNERHQLTTAAWDGFNIVIPLAAPFFDDSIDYLIHYPSGDRLERGRDWITGWLFQSATGEIGLNISSCIYLFNNALDGHIEIPSYQCLGGEHQLSREKLTEILADKLLNPQRYYWEFVANLPQIYRPLDHDQDIDTFTELGELLDALREISTAIRDTPWAAMLQAHLIENNPHDVNKDDVDLGNVQNWLTATLADIVDINQLPTNRYVNPPIVAEMINRIAINALNTFAARRDNPNQVTWDQTGAVNELGVRTIIAEVLTGSSIGALDAATLQGRTASQLVQESLTAMNDALLETQNYMLAQIQSILAGYRADDTNRFAGKTESEWDFRVIGLIRTMSPVRRFAPIMEVSNDPASGAINSVTATEPTTTLICNISPVAQSDVATAQTIHYRVTFAGYVVDLNIKQDLSGGTVVNIDNSQNTLPAGWTFFLDDHNDGTRRLWVTAPANRPAFDVFYISTAGIEMATGNVFYGPSSQFQYTHTNQVNLTKVETVNRKYLNDTFRPNLKNEIMGDVQQIINNLPEPVIPEVNTDGSYFWMLFDTSAFPAAVEITDVMIARALNASGLFGNIYSDHSASLTRNYWNSKPHDPRSIRLQVCNAVNGGQQYELPTEYFGGVLSLSTDKVDVRVIVPADIDGARRVVYLGIAKRLFIYNPTNPQSSKWIPEKPNGNGVVLGQQLLDAGDAYGPTYNSITGTTSGGTVRLRSDIEYDDGNTYLTPMYFYAPSLGGPGVKAVIEYPIGSEINLVAPVTATLRRKEDNVVVLTLTGGYVDPQNPNWIAFDLDNMINLPAIDTVFTTHYLVIS